MSAVLRIALSAFSFVPLQRVLNIIGATLAILALLWELVRPAAVPIATAFMALGVLLIVMTPFGGGGGALRFASAPSLLHLRPHGRLRMLLGAGLGVTLIAALVVFPFLLGQLLDVRPPRKSDVPILPLFGVMWLGTALAWAAMFAILGGRKPLFPLLFIVPFSIRPIVRYMGTSNIAVTGYVLTALAALTACVVWYVRTDVVRRPAGGNTSLVGFGGNVRERETAPIPSRNAILRQYLVGSSSLTSSVLSGLLMLGMMAAFFLLPGPAEARASGPNPFVIVMVATLGIGAVTLGHMIARRARLLWLRAGMDRAALFTVAEREGLISGAAGYGLPLAALIGIGIFLQPDLAGAYLAYGLVSMTAALCFFHAGLATTRNWDAADISLMAGMALLQVVLTALARPGAENSIAWALGFTAGLAVLTPILRDYARRRWLLLDWRVMRMLQTRR